MSFKKIFLVIVGCFAGLLLLFIGSVLLATLIFSDKPQGLAKESGLVWLRLRE